MLSSIMSYKERGHFGNPKYRGNTTGKIIVDLLNYYKPKRFIEVFAGGGSGFDASKSLGYTNSIHLDLNPKWGGFNALTDEFPGGDFYFSHPPYWNIIKYSGKGNMWGDTVHNDDLSQVASYDEFISKLNIINAKIMQALSKGGRHAFLMGDVRRKGKYYSIIKDMSYFGELEAHIIKQQHNMKSSHTSYKKTFIPIEHEHLLIFRKEAIWALNIKINKEVRFDLKQSSLMTWRDVISSTLEEIGHEATLNEIYEIVKDTKKATMNKHWKEKVRQTLQINDEFMSFSRGIWGLTMFNKKSA